MLVPPPLQVNDFEDSELVIVTEKVAVVPAELPLLMLDDVTDTVGDGTLVATVIVGESVVLFDIEAPDVTAVE
jgi:hypothetical protein